MLHGLSNAPTANASEEGPFQSATAVALPD